MKNLQLEEDARGYVSVDKTICFRCVDDQFLIEQIQRHAMFGSCDYCGQQFEEPVAVNFSFVMDLIYTSFTLYFTEPTQAGVAWDGGFIEESISTEQAFEYMGLSCHQHLYTDIENAFIGDNWIATADGHWLGRHSHEILDSAWENFVYTVKHENRYFFGMDRPDDQKYDQELSPMALLLQISEYVTELNFVSTIKAGITLFRAREFLSGDNWTPNAKSMGAPPPELARAGRMNPAGISYFYTALDSATAISEILKGPPTRIMLARFYTNQDIFVLDLRPFEDLPSIFNVGEKEKREKMLFLHGFFREISKPISKDGREHIDYVPSQVTCEYFAKVANLQSEGKKLQGILYPSAVNRGGVNLVIFPDHGEYSEYFSPLEFQNSIEHQLDDWEDIKAIL